MAFPAKPTRCPACGQSSAAVIESRQVASVTRRRRHCSSCNERFTTYELSQEEYYGLLDKVKRLQRIEAALADIAPAPERKHQPDQLGPSQCGRCSYSSAFGCSLGYPEYGTPEAADCLMFEPRES